MSHTHCNILIDGHEDHTKFCCISQDPRCEFHRTPTIGVLREMAIKVITNWGSAILERQTDPVKYIKAIMLAVEEEFKIRDIIHSDNEILRFIAYGAKETP